MHTEPHQPSWVLFLLTVALAAFGLVMVLLASSIDGTLMHNNPYHYFMRQGIWLAVSIPFMLVAMYLPQFWLRALVYVGYPISVILLALVPFFGTSLGMGAKRWLDVGFTTFMPSEIVKPFLIMALALVIENLEMGIKKWKGFAKALLPLLPVVILVVTQPDLGTTIVLAGGYCIIMFIAGMRWIHTALIAAGASGALAVMLKLYPYQYERFLTWENPWRDPGGSGWQIIQSMYAISSGGVLGLGFGNSHQKYGYLPEPMSDFIFAIISEEFGMIGSLLVILGFVLIFFIGVNIAMSSRNTFMSMTAMGITIMIVLQAMINIAVVTALIPNTGIPMPFISNGGTSLFMNMLSMGILLNVSRYTVKASPMPREPR